MGRHPLDGVPPSEELLDRAVAALVREWGVTEQEARDALDRVRHRERRLRIKPAPPVVDLTEPPDGGWAVYLDHGRPVYGKAEVW